MKKYALSRYVAMGLGLCGLWSLQAKAADMEALPLTSSVFSTEENAKAIYDELRQKPRLLTPRGMTGEIRYQKKVGNLICQYSSTSSNPPRHGYQCAYTPESELQ